MLLIIKKSALFACFQIPIFAIVNYYIFSLKIEPFIQNKFAELTKPDVNAEIVILGACRSLCGVDVRTLESLNQKIFNFSMHGANSAYIKDWYNKMFKKYYKKPKLIIFSIEFGLFADSRNFSQDSEFFPAGFFLEALFDREVSKKNLILNRFPLIKYIPAYQIYKPSIDPWQKTKYYKGSVPLEKKQNFSASYLEKVRLAMNNEYKNNSRYVEILKELVSQFKSEGIPTVYIVVPDYHKNLGSYLPSRGAGEIVEILKKSADGTDVMFLDYNNDLISDVNRSAWLYYGATNLNEDGRYAFSRLLCKDLARVLLSMHRREFDHNPTYEAALDLARFSVCTGEKNLAENFIREAFQMNPYKSSFDTGKIHADIGNIYYDYEEDEKALLYFKRAIKMNSKQSDVFMKMGIIYYRKEDYPNAEKQYFRAIDISPDNAQVHARLGIVYAKAKEYKKAEQSFQKAIEFDPQQSEFYNNLGTVYFTLRDFQKALIFYQRAKELNPKDSIINENLEDLYKILQKIQHK